MIYKDRIFCIYAIECKTNKKLYIGRTTNIKNRIDVHFNSLKTGTHKNKMLLEDFKKYGVKDFVVHILEENITYENRYKEYEYMEEYNTYDKKFGYNFGDVRKKETYKVPIDYDKPQNVYRNLCKKS